MNLKLIFVDIFCWLVTCRRNFFTKNNEFVKFWIKIKYLLFLSQNYYAPNTEETWQNFGRVKTILKSIKYIDTLYNETNMRKKSKKDKCNIFPKQLVFLLFFN